jgi:uracil-DNA glycosylase
MHPCRAADGEPVDRPTIWSRRNGPWRRLSLLWVGAAPGNAGGLGSSDLGAHGTRIPFGGDIAGGNLDVLLACIGVTRNETWIVAALNQLPRRGGGEPSTAELAAPVGGLPDSVALLRDTVIAVGPRLVVALGNIALRTLCAALTRPDAAAPGAHRQIAPVRLPGKARLEAAGFVRGTPIPWPDQLLPLDAGLRQQWRRAWGDEPGFHVLPLLHPSAQNMSPFAGRETLFHQRMLQTRDALISGVRSVLGMEPPARRPAVPIEGPGIYNLPEWRMRIAARHQKLDELWRNAGV